MLCTVHVYLSEASSVSHSVLLFSTGMTSLTETDPPHSRDQPRVNYDSQVESLQRLRSTSFSAPSHTTLTFTATKLKAQKKNKQKQQHENGSEGQDSVGLNWKMLITCSLYTCLVHIMLCEDNKSFVLCFHAQSKTQECYANLSLKAPRLQSGRSSPQIQYSDVVHLEEPTESEKDDEGNTDALSTMSDLYASVQTQRAKTVDTADGGEGYANHL